ncbi:ABC-type spermidine/putrescine transport system, permease component II [Gottschalkia purinilytica]|uniref:ABC-type spermidine/putrescine transport system, permease component II n=1 Tax=Gottschalkia purinilytica TaxID=1503 RepID=A0A0L0W8H1_GOTPU|nr:ABC transporter permease [Gottschalkia purinilytica]KNF07868.1 ABC-type spermidine/putrescine transport system, permease component II [Gottschalkia purinilytica]
MNQGTGKVSKFFTILVFIFIVIPLIIIIGTSFAGESYLAFPPKSFSLKWFHNVFKYEMFRNSFKVSLEISILSTLIAMLIGIPSAYILSRYEFRFKNVLNSFFLSPILIPGIILGFALLRYLILVLKLPIYMSLLIGHVIIVIPYIIRVISSSLTSFDYSIEEASISLGASKVRTFFTIVLPNIKSGVIAAFILAFINSFNDVPVSLFLVGPGISTLPIQMLSYVEFYFDPTVSALSTLMMIVTAILMYIIERTLGLSHFTK